MDEHTETMTRAERTAANVAARVERDRLAAEARAARRDAEASALPDFGEPPDPDSPDALRDLFRAAYAGLWYVITKRSTSDQDRIAAFGVARLASGVGKEAPKPKEYRLPMASLLPQPKPKDGAT